MSSSCVIFPSFPVMDGSWGPVWLNVSDKCGLLIECKQTGNILESWRWSEISHVTIKKTLVVQAKKLNGVKKMIAFSNVADLDRFIRVLNNSVAISSVFNIKRQRKFVVIQASATRVDMKAHFEVAAPKTDMNAKVHGTGASAVPPPPPPPPPMAPMLPKMAYAPKTQDIKPKKVVIESVDVLKELTDGFSKGIFKASDVAKNAGTNGAKRETLMIPQSMPSATEDKAEMISMVELGQETRKLA